MSNVDDSNESPENTHPQLQTSDSNNEQSLRDMLAETIRTMNTMMNKFDSLPRFQ